MRCHIRAILNTMQRRRNTRDLRDIHVLDTIYRCGPVTRREIAEATGMHTTSVTRVIAALAERKLVASLASSDQPRARGRPSERLAVEPDAGCVIGLELGRDQLSMVSVDARGQLQHVEIGLEPPPFEQASTTVSALAGIILEFSRRSARPWDRVRAIGVALQDVVNAQGGWITHADPSATPYPLRRRLERALGRFVLVDDVSRAYAYAEREFGAGRGAADVIYLFVGRHGIGGGIYLDGRMLTSSSGLCGEIGHVVAEDDGLLCQCGSHGCLETVASPARITTRFREYVSRGVLTSVAAPGEATFVDVCRASGQGDKAAHLALTPVALGMAKALAAAVNVTGAPTVIIGGPLRLAGEAFLGEVNASLKRHVIAGLAKHVSVRYAQLPEHAGAWGAAGRAVEAAWARGEFLRPRSRRSAPSTVPS
jgi:predicted NBD/HSP70 family sugar kinase